MLGILYNSDWVSAQYGRNIGSPGYEGTKGNRPRLIVLKAEITFRTE